MRFVKFIIVSVVFSVFVTITPPTNHAQTIKVDCTKEEAKAIRESPNDSVEYLGITLYSGSIKEKDNYDAIVTAYIGSAFRWCRRYESDPSASSHAKQLDEWNGRIFVTLTVDEATSVFENYASNGWLSSYGLGAGPVVGLVLEIEPFINGDVLSGTYVISKTIDGLTNSVVMYGVQAYGEEVHITGIASSYVLDENQNPLNYVDCPRGSEFRYILDYEMTDFIAVQCNGVAIRSDALLQNTGEIPQSLPDSINPGGDFFSYCTNSGGILVIGANNGVGYELFVVTNAQIANGMLVAADLGENIKLGEAEDISLWALSDGENLQFSKPDPYTFIFNKYRCGELYPNGSALVLSTSDNLPAGGFIVPGITLPQATPTPAIATGLPVYRPSALQLNDDGTYTIRSGDNLATIAAKLGVPLDVLADVNDIDDARFIQIGQVLEIPEAEE